MPKQQTQSGYFKPFVFSLAALAFVALAASSVQAADIVQIEEDWELVVGEPDTAVSAPQVTMVMSPTDHIGGQYFLFTLNYIAHPDYEPGGMQVQRWMGEDLIHSRRGDKEGTIHSNNDVIRWTQRMSIDSDGRVTFEIRNGHSASWGNFGSAGILRDTISTSQSNLNDFKPSISIGQSGVSYAGNRVKSLTLMKLRWTLDDGQTHQLVAPIDIDTDLDP